MSDLIVKFNANQAERTYPIFIDSGGLASIPETLPNCLNNKPPSRLFIISDNEVAPLWLSPVRKVLETCYPDTPIHCIEITAGEASKSFSTVEFLLEQCLANGADRACLIVALGGGVVGDLAGFCASILLRGVNYIQIPTTLLAQVDSSVGGKTGMNSKQGKNLIGSFYQPKAVYADLACLDTLSLRHKQAGYAEIVKYGVINDPEFFNWLEKNGEAVLSGDIEACRYAVLKCCEAKAKIVETDEKEQSMRALLNLGHSFGHALEAATSYSDSLLHGEAVAIGMVLALKLSAQLGFMQEEAITRLESHLQKMGMKTHPNQIICDENAPLNAKMLSDYMRQDKKVRAGRITLILVRGIGKAFLETQVSFDQLQMFWEQQLSYHDEVLS